MKIIQIAESLAFGDAVANDVVAIDLLLKDMGMCGGIYATNANNIHKKYLHKIAEPVTKLIDVDNDDIILFHHAIANDYIEELAKLKCYKVLVYHNITPPRFFEGLHEGFRNATQRGLDQLVEYRNIFDFCIAVSEFNKSNLEDMGYKCPIVVCPVLVPFEDYEKEANQNIIKKYSDGITNILFVGRLSPNKKQEDILHTFAIYKKYYDPQARLFLVGSDGLEEYSRELKRYVEELELEDVYLTGSIPFADILAYYRVAHAFICMSEHEGFCVPLIEAMYFKVPILAYDACAVPYTLSGAGVLLSKKDFVLAAAWLNVLVNNKNAREQIIQDQNERLNHFSYETVSQMTRSILEDIIKHSQPEINTLQDFSILKTKVKTDANPFSVVMPLKASDWEIAEHTLPMIWKNINPKQVVVISSADLLPKLKNIPNVVCLDQDRIVSGLTLNNIRRYLKMAGGNTSFSGWFLKQFLTYVYAYVCEDEYYLVWDADTLPLRPINFFEKETGKPYFTLKREYVPSYFKTIKKLFDMEKVFPESFISEHQMVKSEYAIEMFNAMEENEQLDGKAFWEKAINACDFSEWNQPFADYESYGTFVAHRYPGAYAMRKLNTFRPATSFFGTKPSKEVLEWLAKDFDTASFEHWDEPIKWIVRESNNRKTRELYSAKEFILRCCDKQEQRAQTGNDEEKEIYRRLCAKMEFDYLFGDETVYEKHQKQR